MNKLYFRKKSANFKLAIYKENSFENSCHMSDHKVRLLKKLERPFQNQIVRMITPWYLILGWNFHRPFYLERSSSKINSDILSLYSQAVGLGSWVSSNSFLNPFLKSKFTKKIPWYQKKIDFRRPISKISLVI